MEHREKLLDRETAMAIGGKMKRIESVLSGCGGALAARDYIRFVLIFDTLV